ncbi:MAG: flagellar basal body P-ring formation chaperone FlgA [Ignavibacteriales bacterium]|nr:flagellar basal body P-ring formation chaperone FlgA [Ignavibacteriales bacterium]
MAANSGENTFTRKLENYLGKNLSRFEKWSYELVSNNKNSLSQSSNIEIDTEKVFNRITSYGYVPVKVLQANGKMVSSFITVRFHLYQKVLCSLKKIKNSSALSVEDFELVLMEVSNLKDNPICNLNEIINYRAKLNIMDGAVLLERMIEKIPEVMAGDNVNAVLDNGDVSISFLAKARTDGRIGDEIKVVTKEKKIFTAKVVSAGKVIITE